VKLRVWGKEKAGLGRGASGARASKKKRRDFPKKQGGRNDLNLYQKDAGGGEKKTCGSVSGKGVEIPSSGEGWCQKTAGIGFCQATSGMKEEGVWVRNNRQDQKRRK